MSSAREKLDLRSTGRGGWKWICGWWCRDSVKRADWAGRRTSQSLGGGLMLRSGSCRRRGSRGSSFHSGNHTGPDANGRQSRRKDGEQRQIGREVAFELLA